MQRTFMKRALAIRHVHFEDLGSFAAVLRRRGFDIEFLDASDLNVSKIDSTATDLLFILGGPIGAYEIGSYPWLSDEIKLIEQRLKSGRPMVGICLGAQLIAQTLDARVYPMKSKEIGFATLELTKEGDNSCLKWLRGVDVLHWHGDMFDLPRGATRLAFTSLCPNQAFSYATNVLGLQFHIEVQPEAFEQWLIGHAHELAANGIDLPQMRGAMRIIGSAATHVAGNVLEDWLTVSIS